jgi:hypothetical protein
MEAAPCVLVRCRDASLVDAMCKDLLVVAVDDPTVRSPVKLIDFVAGSKTIRSLSTWLIENLDALCWSFTGPSSTVDLPPAAILTALRELAAFDFTSNCA